MLLTVYWMSEQYTLTHKDSGENFVVCLWLCDRDSDETLEREVLHKGLSAQNLSRVLQWATLLRMFQNEGRFKYSKNDMP